MCAYGVQCILQWAYLYKLCGFSQADDNDVDDDDDDDDE